MSHTPGPWKASRFINEACAIDAPTWSELAVVHGQEDAPHPEADPLWNEARANATLIAAAPELLDAVKDARAVLRLADRSDAWRMERDRAVAVIEAAIAKAEGK